MSGLTPQQVKAAILIGCGEPKKKAAEEAGVSPQTISYWMHDTEFKEFIDGMKNEMMIEARNRLRNLLSLSIDNLETIITSSDSDSVKLQAIKLVLDQARVSFPTTGLWD
jgi:hypothetical protein